MQGKNSQFPPLTPMFPEFKMFSSPFLLLAFVALGTTLPSTPSKRQSTTTPYQIHGVEDPIYHLYLQGLPGSLSTPVMGPEATGEYYIIDETIQSQNTSLYLNIGNSSTSYLPLSLDATATTTAWGLEGDTIITESGSVYGRRRFSLPITFLLPFILSLTSLSHLIPSPTELNFLVCNSTTEGYFNLYLQTGSDVPTNETCSNYQTIHLPCLC